VYCRRQEAPQGRTGFWNPFGVCRDISAASSRWTTIPISMPPCRMLHVVEGGDYGYQFRYGRSGRHPFQAVGRPDPRHAADVAASARPRARSSVYESDGLPEKYRGSLLVASWAATASSGTS